ncbi:MAG TPA: OmpA family protein, partial [Elusimicrobiales bacterium]|nr:OmpA family protein [Elusimicrobiales bacterium]
TATDALGARISIKTFLSVKTGADKLSMQAQPAKGSKQATGKKPPPTDLGRQYKEYFIPFNSGAAALPKNSAAALKKVAIGIKTAPLAKVVVTGYAATDETEGSATRLAMRRANAISLILTRDYGISEDRLEVKKKVSDNARPVVKVALVGKGENI